MIQSWRANSVFQRSLDQTKGRPSYIVTRNFGFTEDPTGTVPRSD